MSLFSNLFSRPNTTHPGVFLSPAKIAEVVAECKAKNIVYASLHYVGVANADTTGQAITTYHKKTLGWKKDGYHIFLNDNGNVEHLEPIGTRVNGMKRTGNAWYKPWSRYNSNEKWIGVQTLQICFETLNGYKFSAIQDQCLIALFKALIKAIPNFTIGGHREFPDFANKNYRQNTLCPGFSVSDWLMDRGIPRANCFFEVWTPEGNI